MKLTEMMKKYIEESELHSKSRSMKLLPENFISGDLPLKPTKNHWELLESSGRLSRRYTFKKLQQRNLFIEELLEYEEKNRHFGKIVIEDLSITIEVWTKDLESVTELDKEYARNCDSLYHDVILVNFNENKF